MKIAYTVFHDKQYDNLLNNNRSNNVKALHEECKNKIDYIDNDVIMIKDLTSYKIALKNNIELRRLSLSGKMRFGAVGLIFTTFLAYQKMIKTDYDIFLIFEDDAQLKSNSINMVLEYINELPDDFDIVSFYDNKSFYSKYSSSHEIGLDNICLYYNRISTLAYAISKNGMEKYLRYMKVIVDNPIDLYLFDENKNTKKYAIKPSSDQPFYSDYFLENGEPDYQNSHINKTDEFIFGDKVWQILEHYGLEGHYLKLR